MTYSNRETIIVSKFIYIIFTHNYSFALFVVPNNDSLPI